MPMYRIEIEWLGEECQWVATIYRDGKVIEQVWNETMADLWDSIADAVGEEY